VSDLIERLRREVVAANADNRNVTAVPVALLREAAAALEAEQRGRIVGSRAIDGLHVVVASAFTPGVEEQLLVRYDHYLAALEAAREDAWQPIETAPQDGTAVIGFWSGSRGAVGIVNGTNYGITAFNPESGEWYDASEADNEEVWWRPDFWRPLPDPPRIVPDAGQGGGE